MFPHVLIYIVNYYIKEQKKDGINKISHLFFFYNCAELYESYLFHNYLCKGNGETTISGSI